jgi:CRISPR type IV-associated protein Csf1
MLSPTNLIKNICNLPSLAMNVALEDTQCGICGFPICEGETVDVLELSKTFTNARDIANINAHYKCDSCTSVMADQRFQKALSANVFCSAGVYPANKKIHRGYWLLNPPAPPYLFVLGVTKSQHVAWRAPVNMSHDVILMQHGDDTVKLRSHALREAVEITVALRKMYEEYAQNLATKKTKSKFRLMPFTYSDMKGQRLFQSEPQRWLLELIETNPEAKLLAEPLFSLTAQECWALDFCLTENLEKPEPLSL